MQSAVVVTLTDPNGFPSRKVFVEDVDDKTRRTFEMKVEHVSGQYFTIEVEFIPPSNSR